MHAPDSEQRCQAWPFRGRGQRAWLKVHVRVCPSPLATVGACRWRELGPQAWVMSHGHLFMQELLPVFSGLLSC